MYELAFVYKGCDVLNLCVLFKISFCCEKCQLGTQVVEVTPRVTGFHHSASQASSLKALIILRGKVAFNGNMCVYFRNVEPLSQE